MENVIDNVTVKVIPRGKRSLMKAKREGSPQLTNLTGQLGAANHQARQAKLIPHDPTRQGIETQMSALMDDMKLNLKKIVSLTGNDRTEKAIFTAGLIATQHNRFRYLQEQLILATQGEAEAEADPKTRKPKIRAVAKVRRFQRWSDK